MRASTSLNSVTIDMTITVGGVNVAGWRLSVFGFIARRLLRVPFRIDVTEDLR